MKRNSDMSGPRANKRVRSGVGGEEPTLRLLIPSKVAGSIIGKGGKNISKLRQDFNAVVQVPDCSGPERVVSIGADMDTAVNIVGQIVPCLEDFFGGNKGEVDVRLLVHHSLAGCVIGKAGTKVKELREKTSAKIKIFSNCCPHSTDRVVSIVGTPDVAISGLKEIVDLLKDTPAKGTVEPYDPQNFEEEYAEEYGGYGLSGGGGGGGGGGPRGPVWEPGPPGPPPLPRGAAPGYPPPGPPPPGRDSNRPRYSRDALASAGGPTDVQQVTVPKELAGAIIGKGGSRIRRVRSDSGAEVTIDEPLPGSNDRVITIKGTPEQIQHAQYLLQQSVRESQAPRNY